jgi:hypothetical protein
MHQALCDLESRYVLFLDPDVIVKRGKFIEKMVAIVEHEEKCYAVGHRIYMNKRGYDIQEQAEATPYIRPYCMLIHREIYHSLPMFVKHGTPCLENMKTASGRGLLLVDFPVLEYVHHEGRGTAGKFGYRLGLRAKIDFILNKLKL